VGNIWRAFALAALASFSACAGRPSSSERTSGGDGGGVDRAGDTSESAAPVPSATGTGSPQASATLAEAATWPFLPAAPAACLERPVGVNTPPSKASVADVVRSPRSVAFESDAFVVMREACHLGPKQTGAACRPFVVLSDTRYAGVKEPMSPSSDLVVFVDDLQQWELFARYRARYVPCSGAGAPAARVIDAKPLQ
jgi:hypothetical protein